MGLFNWLGNLFGTRPAPAAADIPAAPVAPEADEVEPEFLRREERRQRERVDARAGTKVLIIDDSRTVIAVFRKILRSAGYIVFEAENAEDGIEITRQEKPDLVFLDIVLPGMNGFAALRSMRRDPQTRDIPVIMISGNEQAAEQFYAERIGADDFMKKPFSRYEVFARIEALLDEEQRPRCRKTPGTTTVAAQA